MANQSGPFQLYWVVLLSALVYQSSGFTATPGNVADDLIDIFDGLAQEVVGFIDRSSVMGVLTETGVVGLNVVLGTLLGTVSTGVTYLCSAVLNAGTEDVDPSVAAQIEKVQFQLRTACNRYGLPVLEADRFQDNPEFNASNPVVIYATGFLTQANDSQNMDTMAKAYNCRGDVNFLALDVADYTSTLYVWSAKNTAAIGRYVARGLVQLLKVVPLENIHLMGHSLGAQIMGEAGRAFKNLTGKSVPRITGLDPAKPCFIEGQALTILSRGDADFVEIVHTDSYVFGIPDAIGDLDYYPGGKRPVQPGCYGVVCSHNRAWMYYSESVYPGNENNFPAARCSSLFAWNNEQCQGEEFPMLYAAPSSVAGTYFSNVNGQSPYGPNAGASTVPKDCGSCPDEGQSAPN